MQQADSAGDRFVGVGNRDGPGFVEDYAVVAFRFGKPGDGRDGRKRIWELEVSSAETDGKR